MTALVDQHPKVAAVDAELAAVAADVARFQGWLGEQRQRHDQAKVEYEQALAEAIDGDKPPPSRPEPPVTEADFVERMAAFEARRAQFGRDRIRAVAEAAPEIISEAEARAAHVKERAKPHAEALTALVAEVADLQAAITEVHGAQNAIDAQDPRKGSLELEQPPTPTVAALVSAALRDGEVLQVAPVPRRLGMTGVGFQGLPETAWEPPTPPLRGPHQRRTG